MVGKSAPRDPKCLVRACPNRRDAGRFVGGVCAPCAAVLQGTAPPDAPAVGRVCAAVGTRALRPLAHWERRVLHAAMRRSDAFLRHGTRSPIRDDWPVEDACRALYGAWKTLKARRRKTHA